MTAPQAATLPPPPAKSVSANTRAALLTLGAAALLGLLGDFVFRGGEPGLNLFLFVAALGAAAGMLSALTGRHTVTGRWLLISAGFASCFVIRRAEFLLVLDLFAVLLALTLPGLAQVTELPRARLRQYLTGAVVTGLTAAGGTILLMAQDTTWSELKGRRGLKLGQVALGVLLALPVLLVFGSLFSSADPAFKELATWLFRWDISALVQHGAVAAFFFWVSAGLLRGWLWTPKLAGPAPFNLDTPRAGVLPVAMAVGTMLTLFAVFVGLQARWLFGGAALVESVAGLSYAEYARSGFFQMVAASGLAIPVLYGSDVLLDGENDAAKSKIRVMGRVQLLLIGVVMASALHRMWLYMTMFGLTEDRILCVAIIAWLAVVSAWFARTVLAGRRERFTFGAMTSGFAVLAALNAVNPEALIARVNTDRYFENGKLDAQYLSRLSEDAAPVLAERLERLSGDAQCMVGRSLERFTQSVGWRSWNLSRVQARAAVASVGQLSERLAVGCVLPKTPSGP